MNGYIFSGSDFIPLIMILALQNKSYKKYIVHNKDLKPQHNTPLVNIVWKNLKYFVGDLAVLLRSC